VTKLAAALGFLALNFYTYNYLASEAVHPPRTQFEHFPLEIGEWSCSEPGTLDPKVQKNLGATDYLICNYERRDPFGIVSVYVGYHESQVREQGGGAGDTSIHPPAHCLPGSGWDIIANENVHLDFPELPQRDGSVKRLVIAKGKARQLVYYWYQSRGRVISEDWKKILFVGWDRAWQGRTDGALVRMTVPITLGDDDRAEETFREFAPRVVELLPDYVPE
jgi:EpsI family protein